VQLDAFDRRLERDSPAPIAVAVSGGGDSLLALIETAAWAKTANRAVIALSVDHGLQADSAAWTWAAGEAARRLGCDFRSLAWTGPKPATGIPAAARAARHRLLANAAREAGAYVIVTGHTGDDALENTALGQGLLTEWAPSPVWPEGQGLALLRPLLSLRRAEVRGRLAEEGWSWIDDPANDNPAHPRVRARHVIAGQGDLPEAPAPETAALAALARLSNHAIHLPRPACSPRLIAMACVCLGGGERVPRGGRAERLADRIATGEHFIATLAGARITAADDVTIVREPGESRRRTRQSGPVLADEAHNRLWPGRFLTASGLYGRERDLRSWLR
jgi:tRNA(Ile)-lysidine synthase